MSGAASAWGGAGVQTGLQGGEGERLREPEGTSGQLGEPPGQAQAWPGDRGREWVGLS